MKISYDGIGYLAVTMPTNGCDEGHVCALNYEGKAMSCPDGEDFFGVVLTTDNDRAHVQIEGFAKVAYTGTAPVPGFVNLVSNGYGGVTINSDGRMYLVVSVDNAEKTLVLKL
jgi:hypothetical protein